MSTSASITNTTVRTRSLPERPKCSRRRGCAFSAAGSWLVVMARAPACASYEAAQEPNDAPQRRARQIGAEVADRRTFSGFAQSRIRHNQFGKRANLQPLLDGESPWRDELAGVRPDDGG